MSNSRENARKPCSTQIHTARMPSTAHARTGAARSAGGATAYMVCTSRFARSRARVRLPDSTTNPGASAPQLSIPSLRWLNSRFARRSAQGASGASRNANDSGTSRVPGASQICRWKSISRVGRNVCTSRAGSTTVDAPHTTPARRATSVPLSMSRPSTYTAASSVIHGA